MQIWKALSHCSFFHWPKSISISLYILFFWVRKPSFNFPYIGATVELHWAKFNWKSPSLHWASSLPYHNLLTSFFLSYLNLNLLQRSQKKSSTKINVLEVYMVWTDPWVMSMTPSNEKKINFSPSPKNYNEKNLYVFVIAIYFILHSLFKFNSNNIQKSWCDGHPIQQWIGYAIPPVHLICLSFSASLLFHEYARFCCFAHTLFLSLFLNEFTRRFRVHSTSSFVFFWRSLSFQYWLIDFKV